VRLARLTESCGGMRSAGRTVAREGAKAARAVAVGLLQTSLDNQLDVCQALMRIAPTLSAEVLYFDDMHQPPRWRALDGARHGAVPSGAGAEHETGRNVAAGAAVPPLALANVTTENATKPSGDFPPFEARLTARQNRVGAAFEPGDAPASHLFKQRPATACMTRVFSGLAALVLRVRSGAVLRCGPPALARAPLSMK
jgi:hypothetical protein